LCKNGRSGAAAEAQKKAKDTDFGAKMGIFEYFQAEIRHFRDRRFLILIGVHIRVRGVCGCILPVWVPLQLFGAGRGRTAIIANNKIAKSYIAKQHSFWQFELIRLRGIITLS